MNTFEITFLDDCYQINGILLTREELCLYFEIEGLNPIRSLTQSVFHVTILATFYDLYSSKGEAYVVDSLSYFRSNRTELRLEMDKRQQKIEKLPVN